MILLACESAQTGHAQLLGRQYNQRQGVAQGVIRVAAQIRQNARPEGLDPGFRRDGSTCLPRYYIDSMNRIWVVAEGPYVNTHS